MSLNKVMLIGNVGKDPEIRYLEGNSTSGNAKVATFPLATSERYKDRNGNLQENTEWHNIVAWRNLADIIEKNVKKGTQIFIEGKLHTRSWTDQSGNKRYTTEIVADNLQLLGKRSDNPGADAQYQSQSQTQTPVQPNTAQNTATAPAQPAQASVDEPTDDLPF
jgi:single-strand DNA-binding protein